jgi:HSP20 family molecular chaperone IbpA
MISIRNFNISRNLQRLARQNGGLLNATTSRNLSLVPRKRDNKSWLSPSGSIDDSFFSMASNIMRTLEREFDYARRQMERSFGGSTLASILPEVASRLNRNDLITIDEKGNRKFELALDMSDFEPEEIKIKTHGHNLKISAKREKKVNPFFYSFHENSKY